MALLELTNINTYYGPVQVHFDLSISVEPGQIVCLLGGNASGKSTTMKIILGLHQPRSGSVNFDGQPITGLSTPKIIKRGIGSVPEARRLFSTMTVRENLLMGAFTRSDRQGVQEDYERLLDLFPRLKERLTQKAGVLSGGEQQMVAMARALMGRPRLLCMDRADDGTLAAVCGPRAGADSGHQQAGRDDLYGGAERESGAADRRLRLCVADRTDRVGWPSPHTAR